MHARRANAYQQLGVCDLGLGDVPQFQDVGRPVCVLDDRLHDVASIR
jgi:hypothetical protein